MTFRFPVWVYIAAALAKYVVLLSARWLVLAAAGALIAVGIAS